MATTSSESSTPTLIRYLCFQRYPPRCVNLKSSHAFQVGFTITNDLRDEVFLPLDDGDVTIHVGLVAEDEKDIERVGSMPWLGPQSAYKMMSIDCTCLLEAKRGKKRRRGAPAAFRVVAWVNDDDHDHVCDVDKLTKPAGGFLGLISAPIDIFSRDEDAREAARAMQSIRRFRIGESAFAEIAEEGGFELDKHIWDASIHLSSFLARLFRSPGSSPWQSRFAKDPPLDVLELGSGTGLVSIFFASLLLSSLDVAQQKSARLVATDLDSAQPLLVQNISANKHLYPRIHIESAPCDWTEPFAPLHRPDLVLVSDCTYNPSYFADLCRTIASALRAPPPRDVGDAARNSFCLLAKKHRHADEEALWDHLRDALLTYELVAGSATEDWGIWLVKPSEEASGSC